MKRNGLFKNIIAISVSFGVMVLFGTNSSKAVLQSNGNDGATYNLNDWMMNVRKMEELGGAMGLSETVGSNLTSSNGSNNIDVHMEKNTEYGALAILSASSYGNPNKINDGETTTGNATGVVMKNSSEWMAAIVENGLNGYSARYKNNYSYNYVAKRGDAISETAGWHGGGTKYVLIVNDSMGIIRNFSGGSVFSYFARNDARVNSLQETSLDKGYKSRAVIVQGDGV